MGSKYLASLRLRVLMLGIVAASAATCTRVPSDTVADTILALDKSIDALTDSAADVRAILAGLASHLGVAADSSVRSDIGRFLERAPGASADFQCSVDFVRRRARQELIRLEETLRKSAAPPLAPEVCYAAPFAVDLAQAPRTVEIYGYDFDRVPLELFLVARDGYHDVSSALVRRSHYHLTVVLGDRGVRLRSGARSLGLTWGNLIHHSIAVVDPTTPLCSCTIEELHEPHIVEYAPSVVRADRRAAAPAKPLTAWANAVVDYQSNELNASVCMTVTAPRGDGAMRSGCDRAFVRTIDPDRQIEWLFGRAEGRASHQPAGGSSAGSVTPTNGGLVRQWRFSGFGTDTTPPRVSIELGTIRLVSTGGDGCISPIAYLEARRSGAMGAATVKSLDRQLSALAPEILALRPRFAPALR